MQRTPQGQPLIVKGVVFDITKRKQAEEQLAENLANLEQIYKNPFIIYEWKVKPLVTTILSTLIKNMIDPKHPKEYLQAFYQEKMIYDKEQKNNRYSPLNNDISI